MKKVERHHEDHPIRPVELPQDMDKEPAYSLTASHLLEYLFCPRFTYFEYVLDIPQHEEKRFKVEGVGEVGEN